MQVLVLICRVCVGQKNDAMVGVETTPKRRVAVSDRSSHGLLNYV